MTKLFKLLGPSLSVLSRLPSPTNTATKATSHIPHLYYGVSGQRQVLGDRCVWLAGAHLHTHTRTTPTPAAPSTPGPENSSSLLLKDLLPPPLPPGKARKHQPETQQQAVNTLVRKLQDLFSLSEQDALEVLISCLPSLASLASVTRNLRSLKECGIRGEQLKRMPWLLAQDPGELEKKLVKVVGPYLFREHSEGLGFCYLTLHKIAYYQRRFRTEAPTFPNHPNRIYYLAERIQVAVELLTERIGKPHKTLGMDIKRLDAMIDMFHRYGVSPEDIVADLWVFGYCSQRAEERLRRAAELGCTELRPWMCRCSDKIFDRFCERYQSGRDLLGEHDSVFDYLSERLECGRSEVEQAFRSNIIMKKVHISKFSRILNLLFSEGITSEEIRLCMRIFQYSEKRTAARIKELKRAGFFPFPLHILARTPARFSYILAEFNKKKYNRELNTATEGPPPAAPTTITTMEGQEAVSQT